MRKKLKKHLTPLLLKSIDRATAVLTEYRSSLSRTSLGALEEARPQSEMVATIRLLVRLRWAVHLLVPGILLLLQMQDLRLSAPAHEYETTAEYLKSLWPNFTIAATGLLLNLAYRYLLRQERNIRPIAHAQIWLDTLLFALVIYTTGGSSSPFPFLYTIPVLASGMLLSFRVSLGVAALSTFLLGAQSWGQYYSLIASERIFEPLAPLTGKSAYLATTVTLNGILYFVIAFSSGVLTRTIRRQEHALAKRANEATMLHEVSACLQEYTHLDSVLQRIMEILVVRLNIDRALMYIANDAGDGLDLKVTSFHPSLKDAPRDDLRVHFEMKREAGLTAVCAIERTPFNVTDPLNHPLINRELAAKIGLNPFALAPMLARGKVIGVIGIDRKFRGGIITQEEAQTLAVTANQAGLTIQNARLYERG